MSVIQALGVTMLILVGMVIGVSLAAFMSVGWQRRQDRLMVAPEPRRWKHPIPGGPIAGRVVADVLCNGVVVGTTEATPTEPEEAKDGTDTAR